MFTWLTQLIRGHAQRHDARVPHVEVEAPANEKGLDNGYPEMAAHHQQARQRYEETLTRDAYGLADTQHKDAA